MRVVIVLCLLGWLAACGGPLPVGLSALPPRFSDADPHPWPGRSPAEYPVHGIDASRWQGAIDWTVARRAGVNFAFLKATEGGDLLDPRFAEYWSGARQAGVARGAYHFFYFCTPAAVQARWFIANVPREAGSLPPVLDLEWNPFSPTCTFRPPPEVVRSEARIFIDMVTRHYGQAPVIYTTVDFWHENDIAALGGDTWLRSVAGHPAQVYPGARWTFWQYTATGLASGIEGEVDLNAFAGSPAAWQAWYSRRSVR